MLRGVPQSFFWVVSQFTGVGVSETLGVLTLGSLVTSLAASGSTLLLAGLAGSGDRAGALIAIAGFGLVNALLVLIAVRLCGRRWRVGKAHLLVGQGEMVADGGEREDEGATLIRRGEEEAEL